MNEIVRLYPGREIHVILDNLSTHKPKHDRWLTHHTNVHFHFTPTHASWLNQVECWFSILVRGALRGASFTSTQQLRRAIDDFIAYNEDAVPFHWTKATVRQVQPKHSYAKLREVGRELGPARRVVAKVEFHFGQLFPRVAFILTNFQTSSRACHSFRANEVRLWLSAIAYNLGYFWRRLALPVQVANRC